MKRNNKLSIILGICLLLTIITSHSVLGKAGDKKEKNIKQQSIKQLNISGERKEQVNKLIEKGYSEKNVYIAYAFLCDKYGTLDELEEILKQKKDKTSWESIFRNYDKTHEQFQPREFEPDYIDKLIMSEVSADDIMICDKISWKTNKDYKKIMSEHMEGTSFIQISNKLGIICNEEILLKIQVTEEELKNYTTKYKFTREQIFKYSVLAKKTSQNPSKVMDKISKGSNEYRIIADYYEKIFK